MRNIVFGWLLVFNVVLIWGQADISMATQWNNRANFNPASIARPDYIYLFSNIRSQWNGIEGSPQTLNIQASGFNFRLKSAFGLSMVSDVIGMAKISNPMLTYAYKISNSDRWALSFGVSGGIYSRFIDKNLFDPLEINDPFLYAYLDKVIKPDANFGIEFQSKSLVAGLSSTHLFSLFDNNTIYLNSNHRYGYLIYKNTNSNFVNLFTGIQVVNRSYLTVVEWNATVRFKQQTGLTSGPNEIFDIGLSFRTSKQLTALFGVHLSKNFRIGYAFDKSLIAGYNQNGTHEIMMEYRILSRSSQCKTCMGENYWYR